MNFDFPKLSQEELELLARAILFEFENVPFRKQGVHEEGFKEALDEGFWEKVKEELINNNYPTEKFTSLAGNQKGHPKSVRSALAATEIMAEDDGSGRYNSPLADAIELIHRTAERIADSEDIPKRTRINRMVNGALFEKNLTDIWRDPDTGESIPVFTSYESSSIADNTGQKTGSGGETAKTADMRMVSEFFRRDARRYDSGFELL